MKIYAIYDKIAEESGPLFQAKNDLIAVRNTKNMLMQNGVTVPDDYILYHLGEYDTESMELTVLQEPEEILFMNISEEKQKVDLKPIERPKKVARM